MIQVITSLVVTVGPHLSLRPVGGPGDFSPEAPFGTRGVGWMRKHGSF